MLVYATDDDLAEWTGQPAPDGTPRLLRIASGMVRDATVCAIYTVDEDGLPVVDTLRDAMRDAVCAQVEAWQLAGVDPATGAGGRGEGVAEKRIGTAAIRHEPTRAAARGQLARDLCDEARRILAGEGLLAGGPRTLG